MNYKNSRDAAWKILIKHKVKTVPIDIFEICRSEKIRVISFSAGAELIDRLSLREHTVGNDAFSLSRIIFYDDSSCAERQRFSIAHELGHILLHQNVGPTVKNREISSVDDPIESEANIFASRLLAPLCVLHFLGVKSPEEIAKICQISLTAARIRFSRLCAIRERDRVMKFRTGRGCFLSSRLERKVYRNFKYFIIDYSFLSFK